MAKAVAQNTMSPEQQNMMARDIVIGNAIDMTQPIFTSTITAGPGAVINVPVRNVGLLKRFYISIEADISKSVAATETNTLTTFGPANFFSQVVLTDLSNQTRVNTTGWHLHNVASARRQSAFGAAFTNDTPTGIGNNFDVIKYTAGTPGKLKMFYEVPVSYGDLDLRGAIYANVVNATMNLQMTVNPNFFVISTANPVGAVFKSDSATLVGRLTTFTIKIYQNYLDQIPNYNGAPVLPMLDLGTAYLLNNSVVTGLAVSQDNPIPYSNFRNFLSTFVIYDNAGVLNAGTDINTISLQSANYTNIFQLDPRMVALNTRNIMGDDFQPGTYYFDHRKRPIATIQYGNMQLIVNPSVVTGATSQLLVGYESLSAINQVSQAGSLFSN